MPIATLPTPTGLDFCAMGNFGPHNLHENRPGSFVSEETIFATYHNAGVRVFDIRDQYQPKEIASWVPPMPERMIDPRPRVARNALTCDCYVTPRGHHLRHRLERGAPRARVSRLAGPEAQRIRRAEQRRKTGCAPLGMDAIKGGYGS